MADDETEDLVRHMVERQVEPQIRGRELGIQTPFVNTDPNAPEEAGALVTCQGCGRTARMLGMTEADVAGKAVLCPLCIPK